MKSRQRISCTVRIAAALAALAAAPAVANVIPSADPVREALSETVPTGFISGNLSEQDYLIRWDGEVPEGVRIEVVEGSVEWSRVSDSVLIPRVRLRVKSGSASPVIIRVGNTQTRIPGTSSTGAEGVILAPLSGNEKVTLHIGEQAHSFRLEYAPKSQRAQVFVDHTCSPFKVRAGVRKVQKPFWVWIGCRPIHNSMGVHRKQILELYLVSDAGTEEFQLEGQPLKSIAPGLTVVRVDPARKTYEFQTARGVFAIAEKAASEIPYGFIGAGIGPYRYTFQAPGEDVKETVPLATIYGAYALTDTMRVTAFNATVVHRKLMTDSGIYLNSESFRALDRRISFHVMLGMNAIGVKPGNSSLKFKLGAPQGIEATWRDFLRREFALNGGAFIYPNINNTAYYNLWARYGARGYFFEVNYINVRNEVAGTPFMTKAVGLSLGGPLFRIY